MGTFGAVSVGDLRCYSIERPYKPNAGMISAVPAGAYTLQLNARIKRYELTDVPLRKPLRISVANTIDDLKDPLAIGLGDRLGYMRSSTSKPYRWAVRNSEHALDLFMRELRHEEQALLVIVWEA